MIVKDCAASVIRREVAHGATITADQWAHHFSAITALRSALRMIRKILVRKTLSEVHFEGIFRELILEGS